VWNYKDTGDARGKTLTPPTSGNSRTAWRTARPDGRGVEHSPPDRLWLGHRRLAILDVSGIQFLITIIT